MEFETAVKLIRKGVASSESPQHWVDLGAGEGLFTRALGSLLVLNSSILAIDSNHSSLQSIRWDNRQVTLELLVSDFTKLTLHQKYDGIMMAHALHYVKDPKTFLINLKTHLSPAGRLIIVEYERRKANSWVPYPIDFENLKVIGEQAGFSSVTRLEETPSLYDSVTIYSALLNIVELD
jgi:2-polyprenyl-3-methyl-5-hydroxy-6-metoxy-1,4-benzoquinol methylase